MSFSPDSRPEFRIKTYGWCILCHQNPLPHAWFSTTTFSQFHLTYRPHFFLPFLYRVLVMVVESISGRLPSCLASRWASRNPRYAVPGVMPRSAGRSTVWSRGINGARSASGKRHAPGSERPPDIGRQRPAGVGAVAPPATRREKDGKNVWSLRAWVTVVVIVTVSSQQLWLEEACIIQRLGRTRVLWHQLFQGRQRHPHFPEWEERAISKFRGRRLLLLRPLQQLQRVTASSKHPLHHQPWTKKGPRPPPPRWCGSILLRRLGGSETWALVVVWRLKIDEHDLKMSLNEKKYRSLSLKERHKNDPQQLCKEKKRSKEQRKIQRLTGSSIFLTSLPIL